MVSRAFHVKSDKDAIAGWKQDLNSILQIFNVRSGKHSRVAIAERLYVDGVVDEQPYDTLGYPQKWVGCSGSNRGASTSTSKRRSSPSMNRTMLIISQIQARLVIANTMDSPSYGRLVLLPENSLPRHQPPVLDETR